MVVPAERAVHVLSCAIDTGTQRKRFCFQLPTRSPADDAGTSLHQPGVVLPQVSGLGRGNSSGTTLRVVDSAALIEVDT